VPPDDEFVDITIDDCHHLFNSAEIIMPRASKGQSQAHRLAITGASARLMRERGIHAVTVSDLMAAAGLTHGGFYGHFESKETLAGEACTLAFTESLQRWKHRIAARPDRASAFLSLTEGYLSTRSRDTPGASCPTSALVCDVAREPSHSAMRAAFVAGTRQLIDVLASLQSGGDAAADRREALAQFATMVGAVVLARATAGNALSDELLSAAREKLRRTAQSGDATGATPGTGTAISTAQDA
jgi:TetR/AcrR family transcriptional regulator, transcriptional repressor for nem operon